MLVQAAQSVRNHPGPLGHFFRRLKKRKNHNVAVVAVARKLAILAWHVLTEGTPYRYALPETTAAKLRTLRVQATGKKRRGGTARGTKCVSKLPGVPGGSRAVKSLPDVYAAEGVPPLAAAPAAEQRHLAAHQLDTFAAELQQTRRVPRRPQHSDASCPCDP